MRPLQRADCARTQTYELEKGKNDLPWLSEGE